MKKIKQRISVDSISPEDYKIYLQMGKNMAKLRLRNSTTGKNQKMMKAAESDDGLVDWVINDRGLIKDDCDEIIHRKDWDIPSLKGATHNQMYHPHFNIMKKHFFENYKPQHDTAVFILCSSTKPYNNNQTINIYTEKSEGKADFFILSNPGVIPIEYSNYYPFRYYDWVEMEETPEVKKEYTRMIYERVKEWMDHFGYKRVISIVRHPGETYDALMLLKKDGYNIIDVLDDEFVAKLKENKYETMFKHRDCTGLFKMRLLRFAEVKARFSELLA